jgi:NADH-quinone oxidoreductase subunit A
LEPAGSALLESYFPVLLFLAIGAAVGIGGHRDERSACAAERRAETGQREALPVRVRLRGVRGRAHEVRRALLPRRHPLHPFDLEIAFLFPWAIVLQDIGWFGLIAMIVFLGILVVGFVYEWKKGALDGI